MVEINLQQRALNSENCPQDCSSEITAIPKREGLNMVGRFILANAPSIVAILLISLVLIFFYTKRLKWKRKLSKSSRKPS